MEDFDIGFQVGRVAEDRFDVDAIGDDAAFPVCSPEYASGLSLPLTAVDLAQHNLLQLEYPHRDWPEWGKFLAFFRVKQPRPKDRMIFSSYKYALKLPKEAKVSHWGGLVR